MKNMYKPTKPPLVSILDKYALITLSSDIIQKSKLKKRKRKTTKQKIIEHDLSAVGFTNVGLALRL